MAREAAALIARLFTLNENLLETVGRDWEEEPYNDVRYSEMEFLTPAIANIYKDKVLFTMWDPPYAFQLKSRELAFSLKNYFLAVWKNAKTRKQLTGETIRKIKL